MSSIQNKTWILFYRSCIEVNILIKKVDKKDGYSEWIDSNFADLNLLLHNEIAKAKTAVCEHLELDQQSVAKAAEALGTAVHTV